MISETHSKKPRPEFREHSTPYESAESKTQNGRSEHGDPLVLHKEKPAVPKLRVWRHSFAGDMIFFRFMAASLSFSGSRFEFRVEECCAIGPCRKFVSGELFKLSERARQPGIRQPGEMGTSLSDTSDGSTN